MEFTFIFLTYFFISVKGEIKMKFNRRLPSNISSDNIFKTLLINDIYTNITIGNPKQVIPTSIKLQNYPFYIISKNGKAKQDYYFDEKLSTSYNKIEHKAFYYIEDDLYEGDIATENFQFGNKEITNFTFILVNELNDIKNIYEGGNIGLRNNYGSLIGYEGTNIVDNLKKSNLINSYTFFLNFEKNELIFGNLPHEYDSNYKEENYIFCNSISIHDKREWAFEFDEIKYNNDTQFIKERHFWLYPELGVIIGSDNFHTHINNIFFKKYISEGMCFSKNFKDKVDYTEYIYFYCKENVNVDNLGKLTLYHKELNFTFEIDLKDLFYKLNDMKYFLIIFNNFNPFDWKLGLPFFQKYNFVFDIDKKTIGLYKRKGGNFSFSFSFFIYCILILIIICMGYFIYYLLSHKPRKRRANELEDNFEYQAKD